jgi:hypothetical protein
MAIHLLYPNSPKPLVSGWSQVCQHSQDTVEAVCLTSCNPLMQASTLSIEWNINNLNYGNPEKSWENL